MDALLLSLFLCLIIDGLGGQSLHAHHLLHHHGYSGASKAGIALALALYAGLAAAAGFYISTLITPEARSLFFALALGLSAAGLLIPPKAATSTEDSPSGGGFVASMVAMLFGGIGGNAQFVIAGIAAARADPWMAGLGGWLGSIAACLVLGGMLAGHRDMIGVKAARISGAIFLLAVAFFAAMAALRLV
ncbi:MAG: hypothetical protein R3E11_12220 [Sphingobium sp.]|jgi:putative Ca2+/H+ antiporter (TMEM165/GDT1 family)|nr:hypothetical protein [Sphingobium sp.]MCP5400652.1 hypothetical protein [Sphingomonas sp.]